jgi:hypothetical protein
VNSFGNNVIFRYGIDGALPTNTIPTKQASQFVRSKAIAAPVLAGVNQ